MRATRMLRAVDGASIEVLIDEPAANAGPAIVLLPSSQRDSRDFDDLAARLAAAGHRVLRPQPRGMGASSAPPPGMTLHTLAGNVATTIETCADGPAIVAGHAFGHFVARVTDLDHPQLVCGVVVMAAAARVFPDGPESRAGHRFRPVTATCRSRRRAAQRVLRIKPRPHALARRLASPPA